MHMRSVIRGHGQVARFAHRIEISELMDLKICFLNIYKIL
jgi:hypothetical protein